VSLLSKLRSELHYNQSSLREFLYKQIPLNASDAWSWEVKLPDSLMYIVFGMDQAFYANFSRFEQLNQSDILSVNSTINEGENAEKYAALVPTRSQQCGSCMAFATASILTNFYIREFFKNNKNSTLNISRLLTEKDFFVEPYQLLACSNNQLPVDAKYRDEHERLFPNSNGYYVGHACYGGMSPEMLFWAKYNREKIGYEAGIFSKVKDFHKSIQDYEIKLGRYCNDVTKNVGKIQGDFIAFPDYRIKYINKEVFFKGMNASQIADTIMKIVNKYGFIFASAYAPHHDYFSCKVPDNLKDTLFTHHYITIAGIKKSTDVSGANRYYALIHNSWGGSSFDIAPIEDGYVSCNLLNGMFVLDPNV